MTSLLIRLSLLIATTAGSLGCAAYVPARTRFDAYGDYDAPRTTTAIVATAADVKVYYGTAPAGFTLRDHELDVEPGFGHRVLGTVKLSDNDGKCLYKEYWSDEQSPTGRYDKQHVITQLRTRARDAGGNAIIYVASEVTDDGDAAWTCAAVARGDDLGSAWVVVLGDAPTAAVN